MIQHGDRKGPPIPIAPLSPLLYTGFAAPTSYSSGEGPCGRHAGGTPTTISHTRHHSASFQISGWTFPASTPISA